MSLPPPPAPEELKAQAEEAASAVAAEAVKVAPQVPAWFLADVRAHKFRKSNLRAVALSALKAFVLGASGVAVAKTNALAGNNITLTDVESVLFAVGLAGGGAALKVIELALED